jgi:hypothetical protein
MNFRKTFNFRRYMGITQVMSYYRYIEIVKGRWKPVIFKESVGNLTLSEI